MQKEYAADTRHRRNNGHIQPIRIDGRVWLQCCGIPSTLVDGAMDRTTDRALSAEA